MPTEAAQKAAEALVSQAKIIDSKEGPGNGNQDKEPLGLAKQYEARQRVVELPEQADLAPKQKFERLRFNLKHAIDAKDARDQSYFSLDAATDRQLYERLREAHNVLSSIKGDPSLTGMGKMLERAFPLLRARAVAGYFPCPGGRQQTFVLF